MARPASGPQKADAIVVLGGDPGSRGEKALELIREGYALRVVISDPEDNTKKPEVMTDELMRAGVREENIFFEILPKNSYQEAQYSLKLMQEYGWKHVIVVTDPPHILRVDWAWGHVFKGSGMKYTLVATSPPWWEAKHWWANNISKVFVLSEYKKLAYYILVYDIGIPAEWFSVAVF